MRNKALILALRYGVPLLAVSLIVYLMVAKVPDAPAQYYSFVLGVILCTVMFAGRAPAYTVVAVAALEVALYALRGAGLAVSDPDDAWGLVGLIATGLLTVAIVGGLRERLAVASDAASRYGDENAGLRALVSEFSHRLRNDLGALAATARIRSSPTEPADTRAALDALADRIGALAGVYARLDTGRGVDATVGLRPFVEGLCEDLRFAHLSVRPISLSVEVIDVAVPAGRAVLLGLLINELLANALKHAFPGERPGKIRVSLLAHPARTGIWQLRVVDDGVGLRDATTVGTGLGQKLMQARASQLAGTFSLGRVDGQTVGQLDLPAWPDGMEAA